jgi:hypothetical protein
MKTKEERFLAVLKKAMDLGYRLYPSKTASESLNQMENLLQAASKSESGTEDMSQYFAGIENEENIENLEKRFLEGLGYSHYYCGYSMCFSQTIGRTIEDFDEYIECDRLKGEWVQRNYGLAY